MPLLIILAMTIVGFELAPTDLGLVLRYPMNVAVALLSQLLALSMLAVVLIVLLHPDGLGRFASSFTYIEEG